VLVADMAVEAQVVVLTRGACDKELLGEDYRVSELKELTRVWNTYC
jgi:hypothetical protein